MAIADRYIVTLTNDAVEATNYAQFGIECEGALGPTPAEQLAQIVAYAASMRAIMAVSCRIYAVRFIPQGSAVSTYPAFPVAEYAVLRAANTAGLPVLTDWGQDLSAAGFAPALLPLGTSIVVTEYTATGGPAGRGRHFIPFIGNLTVTAGGLVLPSVVTFVQAMYRRYIFPAIGDAGTGDLQPVVLNAAGTTEKFVTNVRCQPIFSNLESRRR